jgi:hypothetical protein
MCEGEGVSHRYREGKAGGSVNMPTALQVALPFVEQSLRQSSGGQTAERASSCISDSMLRHDCAPAAPLGAHCTFTREQCAFQDAELVRTFRRCI